MFLKTQNHTLSQFKQICLITPCVTKLHFNIILQLTSTPLPFNFATKFVCSFNLSTYPLRPPWIHYRVHFMKSLINYFHPFFCYSFLSRNINVNTVLLLVIIMTNTYPQRVIPNTITITMLRVQKYFSLYLINYSTYWNMRIDVWEHVTSVSDDWLIIAPVSSIWCSLKLCRCMGAMQTDR